MVGIYYIYDWDNDEDHLISKKKMCQILGYRNKYDNSSQCAAPGVPGFLRRRFIKFNDESTENLFDAIRKVKKKKTIWQHNDKISELSETKSSLTECDKFSLLSVSR